MDREITPAELGIVNGYSNPPHVSLAFAFGNVSRQCFCSTLYICFMRNRVWARSELWGRFELAAGQSVQSAFADEQSRLLVHLALCSWESSDKAWCVHLFPSGQLSASESDGLRVAPDIYGHSPILLILDDRVFQNIQFDLVFVQSLWLVISQDFETVWHVLKCFILQW